MRATQDEHVLNNVVFKQAVGAHLSGSIVRLASIRAKKTGTIAAHRCLRE